MTRVKCRLVDLCKSPRFNDTQHAGLGLVCITVSGGGFIMYYSIRWGIYYVLQYQVEDLLCIAVSGRGFIMYYRLRWGIYYVLQYQVWDLLCITVSGGEFIMYL